MITVKSNRLQVIMITDYDYPISGVYWSTCHVIPIIKGKQPIMSLSILRSGLSCHLIPITKGKQPIMSQSNLTQ